MADPYQWVNKGIAWADGVLTGSAVACTLTRLACERFERDMARERTEEFPYYFDPDEAERWLAHLARLRHVKGPLAGQLFEPSGWQCFVTMNLYGWRRVSDNRRRFSESYVECPRGQGKSFWVAGLGLGHLTIDGEIGAEIYCGATSEKQAWEVFRPARGMCLNNPDFCAEYGVSAHPRSRTLYVLETGARFEPLIGVPGDGAAPSFAIVDEYHEHPNSDQVDTMTTGMQKRAQPMLFVITTAGTDFGGPCREKRQDCVRILEQTISDETMFAIIFTIDEGDRWDTVAALEKAQPAWTEHINRAFILGELEKARRNPGKQASYRTKYLDQWVGAKAAWLNMLRVQTCGRRGLTLEASLKEHDDWRAFIGLDLASKIDLASMATVLARGDPESPTAEYRIFVDRWVPEAQLQESKNRDRYAKWAAAGLLTVTDGEVIDFSLIEDRLDELVRQLQVLEVGYDPYQATQFATRMMAAGVPMVEVPMTVRQMSPAMKEAEAVIYSKRLSYRADDDALVWQFGNVVAKRDKKDNIFPDKERESAKIDDVVAFLIGLNRAIMSEAGPSVYETRGLVTA